MSRTLPAPSDRAERVAVVRERLGSLLALIQAPASGEGGRADYRPRLLEAADATRRALDRLRPILAPAVAPLGSRLDEVLAAWTTLVGEWTRRGGFESRWIEAEASLVDAAGDFLQAVDQAAMTTAAAEPMRTVTEREAREIVEAPRRVPKSTRLSFSAVDAKTKTDVDGEWSGPDAKVRMTGPSHVWTAQQYTEIAALAEKGVLRFSGDDARGRGERLAKKLRQLAPELAFEEAVEEGSSTPLGGRRKKTLVLRLKPGHRLYVDPYDSAHERAEASARVVADLAADGLRGASDPVDRQVGKVLTHAAKAVKKNLAPETGGGPPETAR